MNPTVQAVTGRALVKGAAPVAAQVPRVVGEAVAQQQKARMSKKQIDSLYEKYNSSNE
jgi:hypothetical protein